MNRLVLIVISIIIFAGASFARSGDTVAVKIGKEARAKVSKVRVKFVSVVEDSRCPTNANCVWAGNAKIKVLVKSSREEREFEMNTGSGPKGNQLDGWAINLVSLTPHPTGTGAPSARSYVAKFTIARLTR